MQYVDQFGKRISIGNKLGTGGEGSVYEIAGVKDLVAKIYHKPVAPEKTTKLAAMALLSTPDIVRVAAWPTAILRQDGGSETVGLVLPRVKDSKEIHELYSPAHRKAHFPRADWRFLIHTARNCAAAFATLHQHNVVIGDVNQGNVFASQQATISLIDCDSFQFQSNGQLFRCPVGVAHFVPPELQHARLSDVVRTVNHDNFGLAILIFHLLFMGRHPFAGRYAGPGDMPIEKAIREYRFAYSRDGASTRMSPPPHALTLSSLPGELGVLFERAFAKGAERTNARPSSLEWARALEQLEARLRQCPDDPGHYYLTQLPSCPWCNVIRTGGPNFFISVTIKAVIAQGATFDLVAIWSQIQAIPRPEQAFRPAPRLPTQRIVSQRTLVGEDDTQLIRIFALIVAAISAASTLLAVVFTSIAIFSVPICIVATIAWVLLKANSPLGRLRRARRLSHNTKLQELDRARANQRAVAQRHQQHFAARRDFLEQTRRSYEYIRGQREADLRLLQQQIHQRQLEDFLRQFFISDAKIAGIGQLRVAALDSYGIETAADVVSQDVMRVPGFKEKLTQKLVAWRREKESHFRFSASKGVPQSDIQAVEMKYAQMRSQYERCLHHGPHELRQIVTAAKAEVEGLDAMIAGLEHEVEQALADLKGLADVPWWQ